MRMPRLKVPEGTDGIYHCYSRIVGGDYIFKHREKNKFLHLMWHIGDFLGIQVLDHSVMSNHYHQIIFVPGIIELSDEQLLGRIRNYYGEASSHHKKFREAMARGDKSTHLLRPQYTKRMANLSEFKKTLKQCFSTWYNKQKSRKGTLWMERFGSTVTEDSPHAAMAMAAYVDLNSVRASLVDDPKDYPFCGYAAALAGSERCRNGLKRILQIESWEEAAAVYRRYLLLKGQIEVPGKPGKISRKILLKSLNDKGRLSEPELLRLKVRYFSDGLAFGSEEFVEQLFQQYRSHFGERRKSGARAIRGLPDSRLHVLRDLRNSVFS